MAKLLDLVDRPTREQVDSWLESAAKIPAVPINEAADGFLGLAAEVLALREYEQKFVKMMVYAEHLEFELEELRADMKSREPVAPAGGGGQDANLLSGLLANARAVLRERIGSALTTDERKLLDTLVKITGESWPALGAARSCARFGCRGH